MIQSGSAFSIERAFRHPVKSPNVETKIQMKYVHKMITTKIITPTSSAYNYQLLIGHILEQSLKYKPDAEIVYRDKTRYTYRDLYKRVSRLANLLTGPR